MAYCGYAEFLIVIIFIVVVILLIILRLLFLVFIRNFDILVISFKVFRVGFFGDIEIMLTVWNLLFLFIVLIIRIRVAIFSFSYIRGVFVRNFMLLYLRFIFRIFWLIVNNNFYWIILGWDGLGVVSFLLIVFYINHESINNGLFTLFQNRVGDLFFVLFIVGVVELSISRRLILKWGILFLIIGRIVKSAQYPFNSWLLAAIRAPTPISSLVHSSTLVVAGVYILLQFRYCLREYLFVLKFIRVLTLLLRTLGLVVELDIKKLIAYSTLRHVSLIMFLLRLKLFKVTYFHLNIHAMFKSTIFICFGFVILASFHRQDKRLVSLVSLNPVMKVLYYFSRLCLIGLPFLRGFFSKDFIIEKVIEFNSEFLIVVLLLVFLRVRVYYGIKLLRLTNVFYSYSMVDKHYLGMFSVGLIRIIIVLIINIYLRLMLRLSLELLSFKIIIYFFILIFLVLRLISRINLKFNVYDKIKNFKEVWRLDLYLVDQYVYWTMNRVLSYVRIIGNIKLILLMNWWVVVFILVIF